jgi:hypothetical protein
MKQKKSRRRQKKLRRQINGKFNNAGSADKNKQIKYITVVYLLKKIKRQESEIQGLLHPAQANLGYFLAWFQSLQLPSTQSDSPLGVISLAPKSHVSFRIRAQL